MAALTGPPASAPPPVKPAGRPKTFSCPNCGGTVTVKAAGHSIDAVCSHCSSMIDIANENMRLLTVAHQYTRSTLLRIGNRGRLAGIWWEVIGYLEKTDETGIYRWDEHLLYNPYHGFRFLAQYRGHWSLYKVLKRSIADPGLANEIRVDGKKYKRFLKGWAKVAYVKGEFYWRVKKGESVRVADYIAPPYLLSVSSNEEEINAALGEYVDAKTVAMAFSVTEKMPYQAGVAANQPAKYPEGYVGKTWLTAVAFFILATVIQMVSSVSADNAYVYRNSWEISAADKDKTVMTDPFKLPKRGNLLLKTYAPLTNDWLELDVALVNAKDEPVQELKQAVEYYSGSDYDGYWTEGNQFTDNLLPSVPRDEYRLLIDADAGALQQGRPVRFSVEIKRDVPFWSNYWFTLLLILIYPCYVTIRHTSFEYLRWSESDSAALIKSD